MKRLIIFCLLLSSPAFAGPYLGDYDVGDTAVCGYFNTYQPSTGASFTLASGAASVTKGNSATQSTSGVTLDNDFDSVTGRHQVCIDTSADGTFYSDDGRFFVYLSAGTVDSVSVVGTDVFSFSLGVLETSIDIAGTILDTDMTGHQTPGTLGAAIGDGDNGSGMTDAGVNTLNTYDPPTKAEMDARTLPSASYFDFSTDEVNIGSINGCSITGDGGAAPFDVTCP